MYVNPYGFTTATGTILTTTSSSTTSGYAHYLSSITTSSAGTVALGQRIESVNTGDLNSKTVSISGKVYQTSGTTQTVTVSLQKPTALDNFTSVVLIDSFTVSVPSGSWTPFAGQVTVGSSDAVNGLQLNIGVPIPTVAGINIAIGDLQLELGSTATVLEQRLYGVELALCQRYYYRITPGGPINRFLGGAYVVNSVSFNALIPFPATLRTAPTTVEWSGTISDYGGYFSNAVTLCTGTPGVQSSLPHMVVIQLSTTGITSGQGGGFLSQNANGFLGFPAEL